MVAVIAAIVATILLMPVRNVVMLKGPVISDVPSAARATIVAATVPLVAVVVVRALTEVVAPSVEAAAVVAVEAEEASVPVVEHPKVNSIFPLT
jgi:hypothetical protein